MAINRSGSVTSRYTPPPDIDRVSALYTEGVLARRQAKRVALANDHIAVFDSRTTALDWLRDDSCPFRPADHYYAPTPVARTAHTASLPTRTGLYASSPAAQQRR